MASNQDSDCSDAIAEEEFQETLHVAVASSGYTMSATIENHPQISRSKPCYKMNNKKRGVAIIFNNKNFHKNLGVSTREGTDHDRDCMMSLLTEMGFDDIRVYNDATSLEMIGAIREVSNEDHFFSDCFVCIILTHGRDGKVFGFDYKVDIDDLVGPIKGNRCESLAGKPKIFFIQACRGRETDGGATYSCTDAECYDIIRIPAEADFLLAYSTVPGYVSWTNPSQGSWFIQAIYGVFKDLWKTEDLNSMMTRVNMKVAYDCETVNHEKQIPCISSMLTKFVYFKM